MSAFDFKKKYKKNFSKGLIKRFENAYEFSDRAIKFILLLRKGVYPYEYTDSWERLGERLLLNKNIFIVIQILKTLQMLIIDMKREYLKFLITKC